MEVEPRIREPTIVCALLFLAAAILLYKEAKEPERYLTIYALIPLLFAGPFAGLAMHLGTAAHDQAKQDIIAEYLNETYEVVTLEPVTLLEDSRAEALATGKDGTVYRVYIAWANSSSTRRGS